MAIFHYFVGFGYCAAFERPELPAKEKPLKIVAKSTRRRATVKDSTAAKVVVK